MAIQSETHNIRQMGQGSGSNFTHSVYVWLLSSSSMVLVWLGERYNLVKRKSEGE